MTFMIGKLNLILAAVTLFLIFLSYLRKKKLTSHPYILFSALTLFLLSIFFMLDISTASWESIPYFVFIQYPWRFLNISVLSLCIIISFYALYFPQKITPAVSLVIIIACIFTSQKYFQPQYLTEENPAKYISQNQIKFDISRISDEYMPPDFKPPKSPLDLPSSPIYQGADLLKIIKNDPTDKIYYIDSKNNLLVLNIAYFPGWIAQVNKFSFTPADINGRLSFWLPKGLKEIHIILTNTPVENFANAISILSIILLLYVSLFLPSIYAEKNKSRRRHPRL